MPAKKTKSKSRTAKSGISNLHKFKFRWWMALILIAVVAGLGVVILRFSHASALTVTQQNGASNGVVASGSFVQAQETYANIVGTTDVGNIDHADIEVCWNFNRQVSNGAPATYSMEVLNWGGGQQAVQPDALYVVANLTKCIRSSVGSPDPNNSFFYKFVGTSENVLQVTGVNRRTLAIYPKTQQPSNPPPAPTPTAPNPVQTLNFPAGQITTVCGYQNAAGYALICPQNIGQWQFAGYTSPWVGSWEQNQAKGVTHPHDSGYWKWGNFCGVKSHVVSDPQLIYYGGDHMYLVPCPTAQDLLTMKTRNSSVRIQEQQVQQEGRIYITKYGPHGPFPPNGNLKSNSGTVPGNTSVCVKNRAGQTFACNTENSIALNKIFSDSNSNPYQAYTTAPSGWKVTRVAVNSEPKYESANGIATAFANFEVKTGKTTYVDFYYDRR